jgi:hypothetical protein
VTEPLKSLPAMFDAAGLEEIQAHATSADGTVVPYFIIKRKDAAMDGGTPTLLYGYGGFEIPLTPGYQGVTGAAWLERGGCYVMANIRGGGEFGPKWHQAALKANRQRAYDDFIAVAEVRCSASVGVACVLLLLHTGHVGELYHYSHTHYARLVFSVSCANRAHQANCSSFLAPHLHGRLRAAVGDGGDSIW